MKKLLLSMTVVIAFVLYSMYVRGTKTNLAVVMPTKSPQDTPALQTPSQAVPQATDTPPVKQGKYKDGEYTGPAVDVFYGFIQVKAIVQGGVLTDVQFLRHPDDRDESIEINSRAMPQLRQEAIQAQSAKVDIVSGATDSSQGFIESLGSALSQAI
jgi:uncharacterized protein with FMN-binding domain